MIWLRVRDVHAEHERLAAAIAPQEIAELHALLTTALSETTRVALGADSVEVEVTLCGDTEMTHLNFDHMGERGPTDILAFPLHEWLIDGLHSRLTDDDGVSPPGTLLLERGARYLPAIARADVSEIRLCARPQSVDGRPFIGLVEGVDGLFMCAGHGPWGISTGPGSAALVVAAILDGAAVPAELQASRRLRGP